MAEAHEEMPEGEEQMRELEEELEHLEEDVEERGFFTKIRDLVKGLMAPSARADEARHESEK